MLKKIATGLAAVAATSALALALPAAAYASTPDDQSEYWGPVYAQHHQAKAQGWVGVDWDRRGRSNEVTVRGRLWDLDNRTYRAGGKCAFVAFQASDFDHDWSPVYYKKYCGYPGSKWFQFQEHDVLSLRTKVCQIGPNSNFPVKCGHWQYIYTAEGE